MEGDNIFLLIEQIGSLLNSLQPRADVKGQIAIVDLPDVTQVKFTLQGDTKIDAAYKLEDMVRTLAFSLRIRLSLELFS